MNYFDVLFAKKQSGGGGTPTLITKTITENGTYNASSDNADGYSQVTVNVPYMEKKSASGDIASFSDGAGYPFLKVKANINPVQDLHGYDYPWVGGAGKNKLPYPYYDTTITKSGVTYTDNGDGTITVNGTRSGGDEYGFIIFGASTAFPLPAGTYTLNGCPSGGSNEAYSIIMYAGGLIIQDTGSGAIFTLESDSTVRIYIKTVSGVTYNNLLFKPMIRLASVTDATFVPYSNICPISGFTGVNVTVSPTTTEGSGTVYPISWQDEAGIVYGGYIDLVSGVLTATKVGIAEYNGETLPSAWISDRDRYVAGNTPTIGAQVVYDLATPQTYQLTRQQINTLIGQNNVWNNTNGQTEVEYFIPIE